jgi:hypothetical protein
MIEKVPEKISKEVNIMSFEKLLKLLYQTTDDHTCCTQKLFPTLPILTVPGNRRLDHNRFYVLFTTTLSNELILHSSLD